MRKEIIEIEAKVDKAVEGVDKLNKSLDSVNENVKEVGASSEKTSKGIGQIGKSVKGIGVALKAAGIGLAISLFAKLSEVFTSNQRVADALSTVMETVSLVFNEFTNTVIDVYDKISDATGGFDALGKVVKGLITLAFTPLKLSFYSIKLGIQEAQLIWEKSFFGGNDEGKIAELNESILETKDAIGEVTTKAAEAGKNVANNLGEAIGEVTQLADGVIKETSKISIKTASENAKAIVGLKNSAQVAAAEQQSLIEKYDRQAEQLRQIRDNDLLSIEERKKANDDLKVVLDEQEKAMLAQADLQVKAAQIDLQKNNSIENQIALTDALSNKQGILAQIEGFRSEQKTNAVALTKEEIDLVNAQSEAEAQLMIEQKRFDAEREQNELVKLQKLQEVAEIEKEVELTRLQNKIDTYKEGTQARLDAEIEFNTKKQELEQAEDERQAEIKELKRTQQLEDIAFELENQMLNNEQRRDLELQQRELLLQDETLSEEKRSQMKEKFAREDVQREKAIAKAKLQMTQQTLGNIAQAFGEQSKAGKAAAAAASLINTYQGITAELATKTVTPFEFGLKIANIAATAAIGFKSVKDILKTNPKSTSGGSVSRPSGGGARSTAAQVQTPNFNLAGSSGINQLADAIGQQEKQPIKAFVVSSDVTTAQQMDRNIIESAGT